jgi:hypothetical protein
MEIGVKKDAFSIDLLQRLVEDFNQVIYLDLFSEAF